jgi:hypothetical protein
MVMRTSQERPGVFEVYDDRGEPIGQVIQPRDAKVVGRSSGTVLLVRDVQMRSWA